MHVMCLGTTATHNNNYNNEGDDVQKTDFFPQIGRTPH